MKRPLLLLAVAFATGIIVGDQVKIPLWTLFLAGLAGLVLAFSIKKVRPYSLWALVFITGWANTIAQTSILSPHDLRRHFSSEPVLATVRGIIVDSPRSKALEENTEETISRSQTRVEVHALKTKGDWQPAAGKVLVSTYGPLGTEFRTGGVVEINGILQLPPKPLAEGLFDYRNYLRRQGIYFQLTARDGHDWKLLSKPATNPAFSERFVAWAKRALKRGLPEEDEPLFLLYAMTLGWKSALDTETSQPFMRSGTMHVFAISGLHVAMIAAILLLLLRICRVPRSWAGAIVIPLLWFYAMATGWQPSAVRSSIMMSIVIFGWSLQRPVDLLNSLGLAALLILLWEPQQLFQASFQLSFIVVFSIALL
ncbi:MAG: ComEC/Rec2 family competence protein, partial [Limisphaerales bacterium]